MRGLAGRIFLLTAALALGCGNPPAPPTPPTSSPRVFPDGTIVDLSHTYDANTVFWPTADPFRLQKVADGITPGGYYYASNNFFTSEHGGTHLDAPVHFARGAHTVDQIPIERFLGVGYVIDVRERAGADADYQVGVEDIAGAEAAQGPIPRDAIVLIRTGFSTRWPDPARYLGTALGGAAGAANLHFPGLHPDGAKWIVANRSIKAVGVDTASIDYGRSTLFESHRILFAANIPAFENLTALEKLPLTGAYVIALPMKIGGGSGAPLRTVAILPQ